MPKQPQPRTVKVSWAEAARDIVIASITHGVFTPFALVLCVLLWMWLVPADVLVTLPGQFIDGLSDWSLGGWSLAVLLAIGWRFHSRYLDRRYKAENQRIGEENTRLHEELTQTKALQRR